MSANDGGKAFPESGTNSRGGMSLRDYFAGQALPVILDRLSDPNDIRRPAQSHPETVAVAAYRFADAMLAVRK